MINVAPTVSKILGLQATKESIGSPIEEIVKAGLRDKTKIMIGGGQIDESIKEYVGADAYGKDALEAVSLAKKWVDVV